MKLRIYTALAVLFLAAALRADEPAKPTSPAPPKTMHLSPRSVQVFTEAQKRLATLAQEERAITAERQALQLQEQAAFDADCRASGGESCKPEQTQGDDPAKWTFTVVPPAPKADQKPAK
jgi:hypothetical protein